MPESGEGTKACPKCAETIKEAAVVCRYCGHDYSAPGTSSRSAQKSNLTAAIDDWADGKGRQTSGCGILIGVILAFLLILAFFSSLMDEYGPSKELPVKTVPKLDDATVAQCDDLLRKAKEAGVLRKEDRAAERLYVDDRLWAEAGPDARHVTTAAAACKWFRVGISDTTIEDGVMVVSWQSGKNLSMAAGGIYYDNMD